MNLFLFPRRRTGLSERWGIFVNCNLLRGPNAGSGRDTLRCSYLGELDSKGSLWRLFREEGLGFGRVGFLSQILGCVAVRACNPFASVVSCCISTRLQCSVGAVAVKPVYISRQLLSKPLICSPSVTTDKPTEDVVGSQIGRSTCSIGLSFSFWESGRRC